jgi:HK97 family phage prohead protease
MTQTDKPRRHSPEATNPARRDPAGHGMRRAADDPATRFAAGSYDPKSRTVTAVLSTGARVRRPGIIEELAISPSAVDLGRVKRGQVRLLDSHNPSSVSAILGTIASAWIEGGNLMGRIQFADTPAGRAAEGMVARGEAGAVSVGYRVSEWTPTGREGEADIWRADRWELMEVSLVSIPADPDALIRSAQTTHSTKGSPMDPEIDDTTTDPREDNSTPPSDGTRAPAQSTRPAMSARDVRAAYDMAERHRLPTDMVRQHIDSGGTMQAFRGLVLDRLAEEADKTRISPITPMFGDEQTFANPDFLGRSISDAIYAKVTGKTPTGPAAELAGRSLLDLGAMILQSRGERVSWVNRNALADRILARGGQHTTSDFPFLLASAGNRVMADAYSVAQTPLKQLARRRTANDFRPVSVLRLSEAPRLEKVIEGGEIKHGSRGEAKEGFKIETYASIFSLSRNAIINDDLGAFGDTSAAFGRAAASTESDLIADLLLANGGNGANLDDGSPVYGTGASRGNKAGAGSAITVSALGDGRQVLRDMTDIDGKTPIAVTPKYLVVGSAKETEAEQVLHELAATQVNEVNPFSGKLTLLVEPRLAGNSWRLFADPGQIATILIAYLAGREGPQIDLREGWDVLGVEFRAVLDFGCAMQDWRGTFLNSGA